MTTVRSLSDLEGTPHAVVFPDAEPRTIRLALEAGESLAPHTHPDREIVFHVIDGTVELNVGDGTHELSAGDVARFDGTRDISPRAIESATALLVLAKRSEE